MAIYARTTEVQDLSGLIDRALNQLTNKSVDTPLQKLVPANAGTGSVIDVVQDFCWTLSPSKPNYVSLTSRGGQKIPNIYVEEREQIQNSLISSAIYYANQLLPNINLDTIQTKLNELLISGIGTRTSFPSLNLDNDRTILPDELRPYLGIYLTRPTGFVYNFPFYNTDSFAADNQWTSDANIAGGPGTIVQGLGDDIKGIASLLNITQPGTFIERPKYYQYNEAGQSITVTFPLYNTFQHNQNILPYKQNYELLWILLFQNRPFRTSFSRVHPPKLYTVTVPGQHYLPYCYISNMQITFQGTQRLLPVTSPHNDITYNTAIPEAYVVSLTFTSLIANTSNMMLTKQFSNLINVTSTTN